MEHQVLSERIGALVTGVDLDAPLSVGVVEELRALMRVHKLLLFGVPDLSVEGQIRAVGAFADVWDEQGDGSRNIFVSNAREGAVLGRPDGLLYHSDCLYMSAPLAVISLYALQVPKSSSPTVFANAQAAADDLPSELRKRLEDARGLYVGGLGGYERLRSDTAPDGAYRVEHPIRYPDRLAGAPSMIVDELYFDRFVGWDLEESDATRATIHGYVFADRNTYVHDWREGDLVVWDNIALHHGRRPVPDDGPRTLRRVVGLDPSVGGYEHLTGRALQIEAERGR
jgi:taurine dioxygenase